jgi:hypothetical protein
VIFAVKPDGDLLWYRYQGNGESDRSGATGWAANSGSPIGNGWQGFRHLFSGGNGVIYAVKPDGDLLWYRYQGNGESDRSGATGWAANSANPDPGWVLIGQHSVVVCLSYPWEATISSS